MLTLSKSERDQLRQVQKQSRRSGTSLYIRVTSILMLDSGVSPQEISDWLGIDDGTVYRYAHGYRESGIEKFCEENYVGYSGKLTNEQQEILKTEVRNNFYRTSKEVKAFIEIQLGVSYKESTVVKLLNRLGFVYKKTRQKSVKAIAEDQQAFIEWVEETLEDPNNEVYFTDGVHPQHNTRPENGWVLKGENFEIEANSGRKRVNINGALSARDVTEVEVVEAEYINSQTLIALMECLEKKHPDGMIHVVCDNAAYNKSWLIKEWQQDHPRVIIKYLPAYAPNLNLIERLWKFMKSKVINSYFYETFADFKIAVLDFFKDIKNYSQELKSLLTLNFRIA
jgi:transposase